MAIGGLQKRRETGFQMTTVEVMLDCAELFFAGRTKARKYSVPYFCC